jgi:hypothetical protein
MDKPGYLARLVKGIGIQVHQNVRRAFYAVAIRHGWRQADYRRWANRAELSEQWDERTAEVARLIPAGASVLELGAGRMTLARLLPAGCRYTPSDIVDRGAGTIVCDLNAPSLPPFPAHDIAVLSGVLEYITDVPRLAAHLVTVCPTVLATYMVADKPSLRQVLQRRARGWSNDYTAAGLIRVFEDAGFTCRQRMPWRTLEIFQFVRRHAA